MNKIVAFVLALCVFSAPLGCSWLKSEGAVAKQDAIECVHQNLGQSVVEIGESLLMAVVEIIFQGGSDWQKDLDLLSDKYGADALACAAKVAQDLFKPADAGSGSGSGSSSPAAAAQDESPADRAAAALARFAKGRAVK